MFKNQRIGLIETIQADDIRQKTRMKLLKFLEENPEMDQYIDYLKNRNNGLYFLLGFAVTVLGVEIILLGYCIAMVV